MNKSAGAIILALHCGLCVGAPGPAFVPAVAASSVGRRPLQGRRASCNAAMASGASFEGKDKSILFVRHGVTEMVRKLLSEMI